MRCLAFLLATTLYAANPELMKVKSVYLLPMANGMDQYLANQLQASGLYLVVADPNAADAVFTDAIGPAFEKKMLELYPPPPPPAKEEEEEEAEAKPKDDAQPRPVSIRRVNGMVFLVARQTKHVVWSAYERPKVGSPEQIDAAAKRVTEKLRKDLGSK